MLLSIIAAVFIGLCIYAGYSDARALRIPNWTNLAIAVLFVPAALVAYLSGLPLPILGGHLMAGVITFVVCFALFAFNVIGGGDAKMLPAVMLWVGPNEAMNYMFMMALIGGALAVIILLGRKYVPAVFMPAMIRAPFEERYVPYGVAIGGGAIFGATQSPMLTNLLSQLSNFY